MSNALPNRDGLWMFYEDGDTGGEQILIINGIVATDDEWEREIGRPPRDVMCENYWESESPNDMPEGIWEFVRPLKEKEKVKSA